MNKWKSLTVRVWWYIRAKYTDHKWFGGRNKRTKEKEWNIREGIIWTKSKSYATQEKRKCFNSAVEREIEQTKKER